MAGYQQLAVCDPDERLDPFLLHNRDAKPIRMYKSNGQLSVELFGGIDESIFDGVYPEVARKARGVITTLRNLFIQFQNALRVNQVGGLAPVSEIDGNVYLSFGQAPSTVTVASHFNERVSISFEITDRGLALICIGGTGKQVISLLEKAIRGCARRS